MNSVAGQGAWLRAVVAVTVAVTAGIVTQTVTATPAQALRQGPAQAPANPSGPLSRQQAVAKAQATGVPVVMDAATTPTDTLTANPDGTVTLHRSLMPVRKNVAGAWADLDATLKTNADGSVSPTLTSSDLALSGGGSGPLATMRAGDKSLSLTLPMSLPRPTLSGNTATYAAVLPGVDLKVTANTLGDFSDVLVVHDATAAANPAVKALTMTTHTTGLRITTDTAGNLTAADPTGHPVFTAPTPLAWDSTAPASSATPATAGSPTSRTVSRPGDTGPDVSAHQAAMAVAVNGDNITLTPAPALLASPSTAWPVYLDPGWTNGKAAWATISATYPDTNYWNTTPDSEDGNTMQVGNVGSIWSHTLVNFNISALAGSQIQKAEFDLTEIWSYSCNPSTVTVYAPSTTLSRSNATWNSWKNVNLGSAVASATVAHGYTSSCPNAGVGFDVKTAIQNAVNARRNTQTFVLTGVNEANDYNSWKEFDAHSAGLSVTYDRAPNKPTGLTTSPVTACVGNPVPSIVGDARVDLYVPVSDPDADNLTVTIDVRQGSTTGALIDHAVLSTPSGTAAVRELSKKLLDDAANQSITQFYWQAKANDGTLDGPTSDWCTFKFDPTRPGQPTAPATLSGAVMGQPKPVTITAPPTGTIPASYIYQLNAATPAVIIADSTGTATITITPNRRVNVLTVTGVSPGGNVGTDAASINFTAAPPQTNEADQDLTGDNIPDLLTVGGRGPIPPGVWLAKGQANAGHAGGTGHVLPDAVDIGANGDGHTTHSTPADFTGTQAITGQFSSNSDGSLQDILTYNPATGTGAVFAGNGDGSAITPRSGSKWDLLPLNDSQFNDETPNDNPDGNNPQQVVNVANSSVTVTGASHYPDLLSINGDDTGHYLDYYEDLDNQVASYGPDKLPTSPPDTSTPTNADWKNWTLASCQINGNTDLFLWNKTSGALYLWTNLHHTRLGNDLTYTQYQLAAAGWNPGVDLTLQAADIDGDGTPQLWTVDAAGTVTTYLTSNLTGGTGTIAPQIAAPLASPNHRWLLTDNTATTAADTAGGTNHASGINAQLDATLNGTNTQNAIGWNTGDQFSPDITLRGTAGYLSTGATAIDTTQSFTVSVWTKTNTLTGHVLSEDGNNYSAFTLYPDSATNQWALYMPRTDTNSPPADGIDGGTVRLGVWTHLAATFNAATGRISLYVNGQPVAAGTHTSTWKASGALQIGAGLFNGQRGGKYDGQIADVQTWNQALTPLQIANLSGTNYTTFTGDDTSYTSGATWTSTCANMAFTNGQLSITETCAKNATVTYGPTGNTQGELDFQPDGSIIIDKGPANPTGAPAWNSGTSGHPKATTILQPDGNLVIYDGDGTVLWASNTANSLDGHALRAHANNQYVCADAAGTNPLIANRTAIGAWETFDILDLGNNKVALRSHANGLYVTADNAGTKPLIASRTAIGPWETFTLSTNPDGSTSLQATINNMYVTAEYQNPALPGGTLIANRTTIGPWEEFDLIGG